MKREDRTMNRSVAGRGVLATATFVWLVLSGCGDAGETSEGAAPQPVDEFVKVVNVETQVIEPGSFTTYVRLTGAVEAWEDVIVSAEESGTIQSFSLEKGSRIGAGQAIARIDDRVLRAQVDESAALARLAAERFERQRQLWEDEEIGSEIAFLQAKYNAEAAAARHGLLEARLDRTVVRSPISGVFDERYVDRGEMVGPGTPVARVIDVGRLKIVGGVPERFAPFVGPDSEARITFDIFPGRVFEGRIGYVGGSVNAANRTFPIEIVMQNPDGLVKPQMVANVEVATDELDHVIVVPQEVVMRTEQGYQVFVVVYNRRAEAEARTVRLGPAFENRVVITEGLEAGDHLVVVGHQMVDPGDRVQIVNRGEDR